MTIKLNSKELYNRLKLAGRIVPQKTTLAAAENFKFEVSENEMTVTATDVVGGIKVKNIPIIEGDAGIASFMVNARLMLQALANVPNQPIDMEYENNNLRVTYAGGYFDVPALNANVFPTFNLDNDCYEIELNPKIIEDGINQVLCSVADDELRPTINGVYMEVQSDKITFVATNGFTLAMREFTEDLPAEMPDLGSIIPQNACRFITEMVKLCASDEIVKMTIGSKNIMIDTSGYRLIYRLIDGRYLNYRGLLPKNENIVEVGVSELISAVNRVSVFADTDALIEVNISETILKIIAKNIGLKTFSEESISVESDFDLRIALQCRRMTMLLNTLESAECKLLFDNEKRPVLIKPSDNENITLLLMPFILN